MPASRPCGAGLGGELLDLFLARPPLSTAVNAVYWMRNRTTTVSGSGGTARESWGPLHGCHHRQDAIATCGYPVDWWGNALQTTCDRRTVAALKAAGAIVFGKTNLPEWSGDWQTSTRCSAPPTTRGCSRTVWFVGWCGRRSRVG